MPWELPILLDDEMAREGWRELQALSRLEDTHHGIKSSRLKVTALETIWYMRNQLLRDTDWAGMAHSLEVRVPLVDVDLNRAIAPLLASCNPPGKLELASVPTMPFPQGILERRKTGFSVPLRRWLMEPSDNMPRDRSLRRWARFLLPREGKAEEEAC